MKRIVLIFSALVLIAGVDCPAQGRFEKSRTAPDENVTFSPDSSFTAFTRGGNLWIKKMADSTLFQITKDKERGVLNGYASWVYYEEILGRSSHYRAFWWSPDSRRVAFFRFDEKEVSVFPIYSTSGKAPAGHVRFTRYPLAGEKNPSVNIGIYDTVTGKVTWADFDECDDQYFGTPFWSEDGNTLYVQRMPRRQNTLDLVAVNADDGKGKSIYHEEYSTWIDWISDAVTTRKGLYMVRDFQSGWQQIYFLSADGGTFKCLTDGPNWDVRIIKVNERLDEIWFCAKRDNRMHSCLYRVNGNKHIYLLTDPEYNARAPKVVGDDIAVTLSNARTLPAQVVIPMSIFNGSKHSKKENSTKIFTIPSPETIDTASRALPRPVRISNEGFDLYGLISYPRGFDPSRKYPVVMQVYGGPGISYVRDDWFSSLPYNDWCYANGIIFIAVNPRSSGENGRRGLDESFCHMGAVELRDYVAWAKWLQAEPYIDADRIGVEGFSFGGTTTSMLVLRYPQYFRCGIAGGGVYDWRLYDSHYTERYMMTPSENPEGYDEASVLHWVPIVLDNTCNNIKPLPGALKITHGTTDDNVHMQNSLLLMDALQKAGYQFELMLYPDAMHGYSDYQGAHSADADALFWTKWLLQ